MPSILVVEQENRYLEQIQETLAAEGCKVRTVGSQAAALQAAASEAPDLVVVSTALPGMEAVASSFSRSAGGPGVVALLAEDAADAGTGGVEADELLAKPFTSQDLRQVVRRLLSTRREPPPPPPVVSQQHKLTSQEIFGDMLAEVESAVNEVPASSGANFRTTSTRPAPAKGDAEINRKLEETLSGVLGAPAAARPKPAPPRSPMPLTPAAPAPPSPLRSRAGESDDELDALISRTLSSLEMGRPAAPKPAAAPPPPSAPRPAASAAPPAPPAPARPAPPAGSTAAAPPATPAPSESTAVRKAKGAGDIDLSELEELARTRRKPEPPRPAPLEAAPPPLSAIPAAPAASAPPPTPPPPPIAAAPPPVPPPPAPPATAPPPPVATAAPPAPAPPRLPDVAATQRIQVIHEPTPPAPQQPGERFGQYTLQEKIAVGGMAEVWKARMRGVEGFQKTVAIKKILPHLGDNADFVSMFIDEAKLAAQLSHPNIIHIYDLGKIGRDYYIAMEYVEGKDLRSILNAARRKGMPIPLGLSLLIAARLASALDYAHRKRDFDNRELGLVHRDVSPQNVLITFEGDIKLCDFGIAKAVSKANQTQMGALKGKLQYMSPEQAWGKQVDARSDIFSLGAILFELLTGERLFPGDSEISILEAVRDGRTRRASSLAPAVPQEVDEIVDRALARDPNDRFPNASEMQGRIEAVLYGLKPTPSHTDLAAYMHRLLSATAEPEPAEPLALEPPELPPLPAPAAAALAEPAGEAPEDAAAVPEVAAVAPLGEVRVEEGERRGRTLLYAAIVALVVVGVVLYFIFGRGKGARAVPPAPAPGVSAQPSGAVPAGSAAPAPPAAPAGTAGTGATGGKPDISGIMAQESAKYQEELNKKLEQRKKEYEATAQKLQKELALAKAAGKSTAPTSSTPSGSAPAGAPPTPAPRPAVEMPPEPAKSAPEAAQREEAPKPPEPAPAPPPARPAPEPRDTPPAISAGAAPAAAPAKAGDLVAAGPGVTLPELVSFLKPEYPPVARRMGVEGTVVVSVLVGENGRVEEAKLLTPIRQDVGINEAALKAARGARYKPAVKDGVKVKMWTRLRIPFKL
jgi:TonB family protein